MTDDQYVVDHQRKQTICLYHFTCLLYLPMILRDGIRRGDVPISPKGHCPSATNLTAIGSRAAQQWYSDVNVLDKTKVRLKVEASVNHLKTFNEIASTYRMSQHWIDCLDPLGQRDQWYFCFDGISVEEIIEICIAHDDSDRYEPISDEPLKLLCQQIERECNSLDLVLTPLGMGMTGSKKDAFNSWLFDGPRAKQWRLASRQINLERKRAAAKSHKVKRSRKLARKQRRSRRR